MNGSDRDSAPNLEQLRVASMRGYGSSGREQGTESLEPSVPWYRWGPYLAERQWGTVREDYSPSGIAWDFCPHDHARSRAHRGARTTYSASAMTGCACASRSPCGTAHPILKERLFGLFGTEGNHGQDVQECYFCLYGTPPHSYMRAHTSTPQDRFPHAELVTDNRRHGRGYPEWELMDTGVFARDRYISTLRSSTPRPPTDIDIRTSAANRAGTPTALHLLPRLWFRNTWAWGRDD